MQFVRPLGRCGVGVDGEYVEEGGGFGIGGAEFGRPGEIGPDGEWGGGVGGEGEGRRVWDRGGGCGGDVCEGGEKRCVKEVERAHCGCG